MVVMGRRIFAWEWMRINSSPDIPYRGGFLLANVMVALVICGVTLAPTGLPARVLSIGPLTFVGPDLLWPVSVALADIPCTRRGEDRS